MGNDTPLKPEAQKIVDDVNALPKSGKVDGTHLYTDLQALYKADGGKDGDKISDNKAYIADMTAVNQKLHAAGILPDMSVFAADQGVVAFLGKDGKVLTAPQDDLSKKTLVPGQPDKTPADKTPADNTPADKTPADKTPADKTPTDKTPAD